MSLFKEDKRAAFMGLVGGVLMLLVVIYGMVQLTNRKFEGHGAGPAAEAGH